MPRQAVTVHPIENDSIKVDGRDNDDKPAQLYADRVWAKTDDELRKETESKIWLSAFANNNPRSDYHWHVDVCYAVCQYRDNTGAMYQQAYDDAVASCG